MAEARVRPARATDDRPLAALHRSAFPDYASTALGPGFCTALLRAYRRRPDAMVLVVDGRQGPRGYLVGAPPAAQREVNRALRRRAAAALLARAWRPSVWRGVRAGPVRERAARMVRRRRGAPSPPPTGPPSSDGAADVRVVLVGVAAAARRGGLADLLLGEFASEARARGHRDADLVVASDNDAARACYERNGWERRPGEGASLRYRLDLRPPGDGSEPDDRPRR